MLNVSLPSALLLQVGRFSGEETVSPAVEGIRNMPALHYKKMTGSYSEGGGTSRKTWMINKSNTSTARSTKLSRSGDVVAGECFRTSAACGVREAEVIA